MEEKLRIFAKRLKALRNEAGLSQQELANKINCPVSLISYYESMRREPGFSKILALCEVFDETPDYLMGITDYRCIKKIAE